MREKDPLDLIGILEKKWNANYSKIHIYSVMNLFSVISTGQAAIVDGEQSQLGNLLIVKSKLRTEVQGLKHAPSSAEPLLVECTPRLQPSGSAEQDLSWDRGGKNGILGVARIKTTRNHLVNRNRH